MRTASTICVQSDEFNKLYMLFLDVAALDEAVIKHGRSSKQVKSRIDCVITRFKSAMALYEENEMEFSGRHKPRGPYKKTRDKLNAGE